MPSFQVLVLGFADGFLSSFPASLPQPFHRCLPSVSFRHFPLPFRFLSSASSPLPATQPLFLPFRLLPVSASQWLSRCSAPAHASSVFPVLPGPVSRAFFPGSRTRLPVRFLSSFPVSLPQPFHRCFPSFPLSFVRFSSGLSACFPVSFDPFSLLLTTQPSALSFLLFPISPGSGSFGARPFLSSLSLSSSVSPVSMRPFRFRYSASCASFLRSLFRVTGTTQLLASCFQLGQPLCFRFRFWLLGLSFWVLVPRSDLTYITT